MNMLIQWYLDEMPKYIEKHKDNPELKKHVQEAKDMLTWIRVSRKEMYDHVPIVWENPTKEERDKAIALVITKYKIREVHKMIKRKITFRRDNSNV